MLKVLVGTGPKQSARLKLLTLAPSAVTTQLIFSSDFIESNDLIFTIYHTRYFLPPTIQGDFESCADILITSYWPHVELGKNV
jgi:hypothetical protein